MKTPSSEFRWFRYCVDREHDLSDLNHALANERVLSVEKHMVNSEGRAWLVVVLEVLPGKSTGKSGGKKDGKHEAEIAALGASERSAYDRLRDLRKDIASRETIPPYAIFNNRQLLEIVRGRVTDLSALATIKGLGTSRLEKYGAAIVEVCRDVFLQHAPESKAEDGNPETRESNGEHT